MENLNQINRLTKKNRYHVVISKANYYKLKNLGKMGDTFDEVLGKILSKNQDTACNLEGEVEGLSTRLQVGE